MCHKEDQRLWIGPHPLAGGDVYAHALANAAQIALFPIGQ